MAERATTEAPTRRDQILLTAAELFARKGVGATTVREIADAVGVLSGSLYHHFESKDAIVDEVLGRYLGTLRERYAETLAHGTSAADRLSRLVHTSVQVAEEQPYATAIYQNELQYLRENPRFKHVQAAAADVQKTWLTVIESGVADGEFRSDVEPRVFYRLIRDSTWLSVRWHRPGPGYPAETLANDITSVFLNGYVAGRGANPAPRARTARGATRRPAKKA